MVKVVEENGYQFMDGGKGENLVLLHGMLGAVSNWQIEADQFIAEYRTVIPVLIIYIVPVKQVMEHPEIFNDILNEWLKNSREA